MSKTKPEPKRWTLEEIRELVEGERMFLEIMGDRRELVGLRKISTDYAGTYIFRAFKLVNDHYEELNIKKLLDEMADFLAPKVKPKTIVKEVLEKLPIVHIIDLKERVEKEPKVTVGVQKGSCVYLYIRGKQGPVFPLQLTE